MLNIRLLTQLVEDSPSSIGSCDGSLRRRYQITLIHTCFAYSATKRCDADLRIISQSQIDIVNEMQLLTAKPVTYLVNLSEKDYIRKKNKWLAKIKQWVDENNTGDLIIPFSVELEERIARMSADEQKAELEKIGGVSALGKIMTVGYQSLQVSSVSVHMDVYAAECIYCSSFVISPRGPMKAAHGPSGKGLWPRRQLESSTPTSRKISSVRKSWPLQTYTSLDRSLQ